MFENVELLNETPGFGITNKQTKKKKPKTKQKRTMPDFIQITNSWKGSLPTVSLPMYVRIRI